jgi:hypothetical protein
MKTDHSNSVETFETKWENFVEYMNQIYFEGAVEILNKELVSFEFSQYIEDFAA